MPNGINGLRCAYTPDVNWRLLREGLTRARNAKNLTLDGAAAEASLNRATIHSIENVKREPDLKPELETIERLVAAYGLTLAEFFASLENKSLLPRTQPDHNSGLLKEAASGPPVPRVVGFTDAQFDQLVRLLQRQPAAEASIEQVTNSRPRQPVRSRPRPKRA